MVAVMIVTLIIIIQRFYKNLLCDEGYLMNTLPMSVWKNITSKLVVASYGIWSASGSSDIHIYYSLSPRNNE